MRILKNVKKRFDSKWNLLDSGCWLWVGSFFKGKSYGQFSITVKTPGSITREVNARAHRVSWNIYRGEIPEGIQVCHKCDNPWCVNPDHLFLGTVQENMADMCSKGRQLKGVKNKSSKLNDESVLEILSSSLSYSKLAEKFHVSKGAIAFIKRRERWKHVVFNQVKKGKL